jgi:hypothetical protein
MSIPVLRSTITRYSPLAAHTARPHRERSPCAVVAPRHSRLRCPIARSRYDVAPCSVDSSLAMKRQRRWARAGWSRKRAASRPVSRQPFGGRVRNACQATVRRGPDPQRLKRGARAAYTPRALASSAAHHRRFSGVSVRVVEWAMSHQPWPRIVARADSGVCVQPGDATAGRSRGSRRHRRFNGPDPRRKRRRQGTPGPLYSRHLPTQTQSVYRGQLWRAVGRAL